MLCFGGKAFYYPGKRKLMNNEHHPLIQVNAFSLQLCTGKTVNPQVNRATINFFKMYSFNAPLPTLQRLFRMQK